MGPSPVHGAREGGLAAALAAAGLVLALALSADASPAFGPKDYVVKPGLPLPAIERFPACQPEKGGQLHVENGPRGQPRASLAVVVLNQRETVVLLEAPGQRRVVDRSVPLAASNTLLVWMIGPPNATLGVSVTSAGACLDVATTSPLPGASVPAGVLLVRGTVAAPSPAGVSVNGVPAMVHGRDWAAAVPVDTTIQTLSVAVAVVGGEPVTTSVPITVEPAPAGSVELQADPGDAIAPLAVTWKVVNDTGRVIVQYELDPTGGGTFDPPVASLDGTHATYSVPGLWFPTVRAVDDQGVVHTSTTAVLASDPAAVSASFDALWGSFKARLQAGDAAGALSFVAPVLRSRMERVFQDLGADLPAVAADFGDLHVTDQMGDLAEAVLVRSEASGRQLYFIQLRRDGLGRWLIEEM
jgi:hypothetical protein